MTYSTGSPIQATDYNTFATLTDGMNQIYTDSYPNSTTLPAAGFGYGQSPALLPVSINENITAAQWASLFNTMRHCGVHQGTPIVPPLPGTAPYNNINPVVNSPVISYPGVSNLITTLENNRFNLAAGQSTLIPGPSFVQGGLTRGWVNSLTFNFQVDFGSWDNARYFFNSGSKVLLYGSYAPVGIPTTEESQFINMLTSMSPLVFGYNSTTPYSGTGGSAVGFYDASTPLAWSTLTQSYKTIYNRARGGAYYYYSANYLLAQAKLDAAPGTNGKIDFSIAMVDADPVPMRHPKTGTTTYRVGRITSSGAVGYNGSYSVSSIGPLGGYVKT